MRTISRSPGSKVLLRRYSSRSRRFTRFRRTDPLTCRETTNATRRRGAPLMTTALRISPRNVRPWRKSRLTSEDAPIRSEDARRSLSAIRSPTLLPCRTHLHRCAETQEWIVTGRRLACALSGASAGEHPCRLWCSSACGIHGSDVGSVCSVDTCASRCCSRR